MNHMIPIGQGKGVSGRYGGLPDDFADEASSKIVILPIPFGLTTTYQQGAQNGPAALIEASRNMELYDIETNSSAYRIGIHTDHAIEAATSESMREQVHRRTREWLEKGKWIMALGGEHSISFPLIQAHSEHFGRISILQIDAHADLAESYEGNPWSHASVMARVRELPGICSIVSVGIRSMSAEESLVVDRRSTFFAHELDVSGNWIGKAVDQLSDSVYITFDVDGLDSALMPSTGTPEPGGLQWNQAMALLKAVSEQKNIVGGDVVELCPSPCNLAPDYLRDWQEYKTESQTVRRCNNRRSLPVRIRFRIELDIRTR